MIPVPPPLNNSVINTYQLYSVCQQSSRYSQNTPRGNQCFNSKDINSNRNELSSPVIPVPNPFNDSVINPPQLSLVRQQSSISSQKTMPESKASSIPGQNSADPSNTMPQPSNKNVSCNVYGFMVDVSKLKLVQQQQHDLMLIHNYHKLCNKNDPSSMFVSPPPIPRIESLSQSTISSLDIGSFGRNLYDVNIQQQTKSEVADTKTVMADNKDLDPPPPQDISNVFAAADLSSCSSSDLAKYKCAWLKTKLTRSYILSAGECPDAFSRALSIALNHR